LTAALLPQPAGSEKSHHRLKQQLLTAKVGPAHGWTITIPVPGARTKRRPPPPPPAPPKPPPTDQRLRSISGRFSVHPPQNDWHTVSIDRGVWRNAAGVEWGIAPIAAHGGRIGDSWRSPAFIASTDCVYWQQGKCGEDWAEGCKLFVQRNATHEVAAIRWLSELYVREPN